MTTCASGQLPFEVHYSTLVVPGDSAAAACSNMIGFTYSGGTWNVAALNSSGICIATGHPSPSLNGDFGAPVQVCDAPPTSAVYWESTPHLLQALIVCAVCFMFVFGYNSGRRP